VITETPAPADGPGEAGLLARRVWVPLFIGWWTLFGLLFAARDRYRTGLGDRDPTAWTELVQVGLLQAYSLATAATLALLAAYCFPIGRGSVPRGIALHLGLGVGAVGAVGVLTHLAGQWIAPASEVPFLNRFVGGFPAWALIYGLMFGIAQGIEYFRKYREHRLRTAQLEGQLLQAQIQALNVQLHPHFLFNTLNAISALMHRDVRQADRMLARLEDLLRLTLAKSAAQEVPLCEELELLEPYLEIEQTRFGDRLTVEWAVDPDALRAAVPQLVLQPILENAIKHGIAARSSAGRIRVAVNRRGDQLEIEVADNGPGLLGPPGRPGGVGLSNTMSRLQKLYGDRQRVDLGNSPGGGARIRIRLPYRPLALEPGAAIRCGEHGRMSAAALPGTAAGVALSSTISTP
jgi:two-component system, LytTR family, sensor kinase